MGILVRAEKQNRGIVVERMLRAVPMVHIPIDDHDAFQSMLLLKIPRGDGHVIEQAEPHGPIPLRMVSGRPYRAEGILHPPRHDGIRRGQRAAGRQIGRRQGARRHRCVRIQRDLPLLRRHGLEFLHIGWRMHFGDPFVLRRPGIDTNQARQHPALFEPAHDRPESIRGLGVA